eukprot:TRINITY_DN5809_c1_g3_i2.p1 TRINITY_DN5809_c1_g3~~TRINITY_DN5809_c1_g3_i2.p1  ORF type:complete len:337 (-),score=73.50 TRINITY_DN5809_c1_g3_i2:26-1036(-)
MQYLDERETGFTKIDDVLFISNEGESQKVCFYIADEEYPEYLGEANVTDIAFQIYSSYGDSGWNGDYLKNLAHTLRRMGVEDSHVYSIESEFIRFNGKFSNAPKSITHNSLEVNTNLNVFVSIDTKELQFVDSPSNGVRRKRVYHSGQAESGRVTSIVEFGAGSSFKNHPHPEGEEIYVIGGVFSDKRGDHEAGTYILNSEGFEHAPFSKDGCLLLVRLRQYHGTDRPSKVVATANIPWTDSLYEGVQKKILFSDNAYPDSALLLKFNEGAVHPPTFYEGGYEMFVLEGTLDIGINSYDVHNWIRFPGGVVPSLSSVSGCTILVKENGLYLAEPII